MVLFSFPGFGNKTCNELSTDTIPATKFVFEFGLGYCIFPNDLYLGSYSAGAKIFTNKKLAYKVRFTVSSRTELFSNGKSSSFEFSPMVGLHTSNELFCLAIYAGAGLFTGSIRGTKTYLNDPYYSGSIPIEIPFSTFGVPIELEFRVLPDSSFGVGLSMYANLNNEYFVYGFLFRLELGE